MGEDGSVVIGVDLNVKEAEKELSRLTKKVLQLEEEVGRAGAHRDALKEQWEQATKALEEYRAANSRAIKGASTPFFEGDPAKLAELAENAAKLKKEFEKYDEQVKQGNIDLKYTKERYAAIATEEQRLRKETEARRQAEQNATQNTDESNIDRQTSMFERFKEKAQEGLNGLKNGFIGLGQVAKTALGAVARGAVSVAKGAFPSAKKAVSGFAKGIVFAGKSIASLGKSIMGAVKNLNVFSKLTQKIGPAISRLGKMITRVFVFSVITSGLRMLRTQLTSYLSTNTELMTALGRLKGVLLTAFQPIYDAILPALTALINGMTQAVAVAAQFIATIFGTTAKQAQANAKALNEQADATENAGDAAKDAQKYLAGFDTIQQIGGSGKSSASGAGGAEEKSGPLFDYEFDNSAFESWGEAFSYVLDNILGGIDRLKDGFSNFSTWFNGISFNLLEMFQFPGVEEKVQAIGVELATAFDGLTSAINWEQFGQALGAGLGLALMGLLSFVTMFDWQGLGMSLADAFNGLASQINWVEFGRLLWSGFEIGIEMLAGFLVGLSMPELANAASNIITGFLDAVYGTIDSIDWAKIGSRITKVFSGIKWDEIAESANRMINKFFKAAHEFVTNTKWGEIGASIIGFIVALDWGGVASGASQLVVDFMGGLSDFFALSDWAGLGNSITNFFNGIQWAEIATGASNLIINFSDALFELIANIDWYQLGKDVETFFVNIDWAGIATSVFHALGGAFGGLAAFVVGLFENAFNSLVSYFTKWIEWGEESGNGIILGILAGIGNAIVGIGQWIYDNIFKPFIDGFCEVFGIHSPSTVMAEQGGYIMDGLLGGLVAGLQPVIDLFDSVLKSIKEILGGVIQFITGVFTGDWNSAWDGVKSVFIGIWNGIITTLEGAVNLILDGINWMIAQLNKVSFSVPDWVPAIGGKKFGFNIPSVNKISIPRLAQGAVIPPNREFMAVLGDQKQGTNIEAPAQLIKQMVMEALREGSAFGGGQGATFDISVYLDGEVIYRNQQRISKNHGVSLVEG